MNRSLLRKAAAEYFEEGFLYGDVEKEVENTPPDLRAEAYERMRPQRTVPDGCFVWLGHLVWIEKVLEITHPQLTGEEVEGLLVLKRERSRFQAEHPPCPHCGMPNQKFAFDCRECGGKIPH